MQSLGDLQTFHTFDEERLPLLHMIIRESFELPVDGIVRLLHEIPFLDKVSRLEDYRGIKAGSLYPARAVELLCAACEDTKYLNVIGALVNAGTDVNGQDAEGMTPLNVASMHGCTDAVKYLLQRNTSVDVKNAKQESSFLIACKHQQWNVARILHDKEADPFLRD